MKNKVIKEFKKQFNQKYAFSDKSFFNNTFFTDSLLDYDFFKKDFFRDRFSENMEKMNQLFEEMDSVKNSFFMEQSVKKH